MFLQIPWAAHSADLAIKEGYFNFIVRKEIIFNITRILLLPILMLIFYINYHPFIISFIIAGVFTLGYAVLKGK